MTDRIVLGAGIVRLRHIRKGTGDGQVTVLGQVYVPSWSGLNGRRGFQSGQYELRMGEEGAFTIILPNATGDDGVLHRDRFLILTAGKRTPISGGGAYAYSGGTYRPGDEWLEIWFSDPGELLFVGTPTKAKISRDRIEITGFESRWLLKKTRETTAGFWTHSPRDVWEHYCSLWQAHVASDFETEEFIWSTGSTTTPDDVWVYTRLSSSAAEGAPPSSIRLYPNASAQTAQLRSFAGFGVGMADANKHLVWRVETRFLRSTIGSGGFVQVGMLDGSSLPWAYVEFQNDLTKIKTGSYTAKDVGLDTNPPGPFHVIVEGRGRWVYFYCNGKLLGHMPMPSASTTGRPYIALKAGSVTSFEYCDVDLFICRRTIPFLLRGTDKGDYHIPGLPPSGPLMGEYFSDSDVKPYGTGWGSSDYYGSIISPTKDSYSVRGDSALNFGMGIADTLPTWQPNGPAGEYFSARWTGSIYLDLENHDYRFRALVSDGLRLHIGKTRIGEELLDSWTSQTPTYLTPSSWLKAGLSFPAVSGWYPIIAEYMQGQAAGVCVVSGQRDDWPSAAWVPLGLSQLDQEILSDSPIGYWRLGEGGASAVTTAYDSTLGAINGTYVGSPNTAYNTAPLIPGDLCTDFDGTDDGVELGNNHGLLTGPFTIEAWVAVDSFATDRPIIGKMQNVTPPSAHGWELMVQASNSKAVLKRWHGGQNAPAESATALTAGLWHHVVGVWNGTNLTLYLDGVAGPVNGDSSGDLTAHTDILRIGDYPDTFSTSEFDGRISRVAIYNQALSQARIQAHYSSRWAYNDLQFSPFGTFRAHVRFESHYDVLRTLAETFGYQSASSQHQLESASFPQQCVPRVRVGRDTERELSASEATDISTDINAEDVCDSLFADAQGLGDEEITQLTAEGLRFDEVLNHILIAQEYDSLSDIAFPPLLDQRLNSLLALRGSVWEEVAARPPGFRELLDAFPLPDTPEFQEFAWEPGDGIRLKLQEIGVDDSSPRQILGIQRAFVPDGVGKPVVSFRQRPRNLKDMMRKLARGPLVYRRNFQGQVITISGSVGGQNASPDVVDPFSRAAVPFNVEEIIKGTLYVLSKADTSSYTVEINGTGRFTITSVGTYDITAWTKPDAANPQVHVRLTGGTGSVTYKSELLVKLPHG